MGSAGWMRLAAVSLVALTVLMAGCGGEEKEVGLMPSPTATAPSPTVEATSAADESTPEPEVTLLAVGDIMLGRGVAGRVAQYGPNYPFTEVMPLLRDADIAFGNLEAPLTERRSAAEKDYVFRGSPTAAEGLAWAGFDVLSLANNHALDYGYEGLQDTVAALQEQGIAFVGTGDNEAAAHSPVILTVNGLRVAFLAYVNLPNDGVSGFSVRNTAADEGRPGVAWGDVDRIMADVAVTREQADVVVVSLHTGLEYRESPSDLQRRLARAAVDAGADLVLGHHPHVLQRIERHKGALIAYSLGNFVFDFDETDYNVPGLPSSLSVMLKVTLTRAGVESFELVPMRLDVNEYRPIPASGQDAEAVLDRMQELTNLDDSP